ncbi:xaa-Pro aminopeptidase 1 [Eurytemora carolleeae]|uniref:xaa-Pro aminopeptidase 1 n=1 Tax=Eurytemora carolleeae TaxID=1294199 RepID=UPI000C77C924|nr:xaa-Pro aminopeptidase 1 [Eurytemora carolleeae]|eukprot:XP_023336292.1 xaa-Pro aminopeptidase 1-like [Eurytemora affinis]
MLVMMFTLYLITQLTPAYSSVLPLQYSNQVYSDLNRSARDITTNCGPNDIPPVNRVNTTDRLKELREEMIMSNLDAYIVPLDEEMRLEWISGFSGSNGQAAVTLTEARLWTDGRYFVQAADQLDCNWYLMKMDEGVPEIQVWLSDVFSGANKSIVVGADPVLAGAGEWLDWENVLKKEDIQLMKSKNLIDNIWTAENGRPPPAAKEIVVHDVLWAGESWTSKVERLRTKLGEEKRFGMILTELDEIAWLFNLRGEGSSNLEGLFNSPLFESMAVVTLDEIILWVHLEKVSDEVKGALNSADCGSTSTCVNILDIENSLETLSNWTLNLDPDSKILVSSPSSYLSGVNFAVYSILPEQNRDMSESPVLNMKSIKNKVEEDGMMNAHVKDALALCEWASRIEKDIQDSRYNWTEISAATLLEEFRRSQEDSRGLSFTTISGFGSNGAIIHYSPSPQTDKNIDSSNLYLVDSGGQYLDGTTDVTRTFHYGTPSQEQIERYTDVLRGAIQLALSRLPENTVDTGIDLVTRQYLFRKGLNYNHGTGHGIGAYLKVHEGPTLINLKGKKSSGLKPGMFFSDEPGYYKTGEYGIRLETILKVVPMDLDNEDYGRFIIFEPVTLVPFEPKLINFSALSSEEISWLNNYNQLIRQHVASRFERDGKIEALDWVQSRTEHIDV